jgi:hypothetical protein
MIALFPKLSYDARIRKTPKQKYSSLSCFLLYLQVLHWGVALEMSFRDFCTLYVKSNRKYGLKFRIWCISDFAA